MLNSITSIWVAHKAEYIASQLFKRDCFWIGSIIGHLSKEQGQALQRLKYIQLSHIKDRQ